MNLIQKNPVKQLENLWQNIQNLLMVLRSYVKKSKRELSSGERALIQKWVDALRSGDYKQGRTHLKKDDRYCVMGVLCEVSNIPQWHEINNKIWGFDDDNYSWRIIIPDVIEHKYFPFLKNGKTIEPIDGRLFESHDLMSLNDGSSSFREMANLIEDVYL